MASTGDEQDWVDDVLAFWFDEVGSSGWFSRSDARDAEIRSRFQELYQRLAGAPAATALGDPKAILATLIVLDQFPRNMFRGEPGAFATDELALDIAREAVQQGIDTAVERDARLFMYLPFEHSEDPDDQARSVALFGALGNAEYLRYAEAHQSVIDRFGRFPHRNEILGRTSTAAEVAFLAEPGSSF